MGWVRKFSGSNLPGAPLRSAARGAHGPPGDLPSVLCPPSPILRPPSVRLPLPRCPRSVISVTKSDPDFCAFCAFLRPISGSKKPIISPSSPRAKPSFTEQAARGAPGPPRKKPSVCSVGHTRPSPASSVSALRELCDKIRFRFLRLLRLFAATPLRSISAVCRLLFTFRFPPFSFSAFSFSLAALPLPLCPRSVNSVTKSDSDFCASCAFLRPTLCRPRSGRPTWPIRRLSSALRFRARHRARHRARQAIKTHPAVPHVTSRACRRRP